MPGLQDKGLDASIGVVVMHQVQQLRCSSSGAAAQVQQLRCSIVGIVGCWP